MDTEYKIKGLEKCNVCDKVDESVVFTKKGTWKTLWFPTTITVCERCISRIFRKFDPKK